jgi:hypothetical protein
MHRKRLTITADYADDTDWKIESQKSEGRGQSTGIFDQRHPGHPRLNPYPRRFGNFCRIHQTLRVTPAMEAGVSDHVWELAEVIALLN